MNELVTFAILGLLAGTAYALSAIGVIVTYRGSGVLNLSHGAIGMVGTYVFWELHFGAPAASVPAAVGVALIASAVLGVGVYVVAVGSLRNTAPIVQVISTLGVLILLQGLALQRYPLETIRVSRFLGASQVKVGGYSLQVEVLVAFVVAVVLALGLTIALRRSRIGLEAAALREDPDIAGVLGIRPHRAGLVTWATGGAIACGGGILIVPTIGLSPTGLTQILIPALAAALFARLSSIHVALLTGLGLGLAESILTGFGVSSGLTRSLPFVVIMVALVLRGNTIPQRGEQGLARLVEVGTGRIRPIPVLIVAGGFIVSLFQMGPAWSDAVTTSAIFSIMALSVVVATGYTGQLSLAPMAFGGVASLATARLAHEAGLPFPVSVALSLVVAAGTGLLVGVPSVRVRGVSLAIVTLGLSLVIERSVLNSTWLTGGAAFGIPMPRPTILGFSVDPFFHPERYAIVCIVVLAAMAVGTANLRRSRAGRRMIAIQANERGAASLGLSVAETKLAGFAISAAIGGLGGSLIAYRGTAALFADFTISNSLLLVGLVVLGGLGSIGGAFVAGVGWGGGVASYALSSVEFVQEYLMVITGLCLILLLRLHPQGASPTFGALLRKLPGMRGPDERRSSRPQPGHSLSTDSSGETLVVKELVVKFGTVTAVNSVSLAVPPGTVVGLIGPNGAGKSAFIDAVSGFTPSAAGHIALGAESLDGMSPTARARAGLARTFQNLELFEEMTVRENVLVSVDDLDRPAYLSGMVVPGRDSLDTMTQEFLELVGLGDRLDVQVGDLAQGQMRLLAAVRAVVTRPSAIMLDEPGSGLSAHERGMLVDLVRRIRASGIGVLVVEHNVDFVAKVCDELVVLDFGSVIASGPTAAVLKDPAVQKAYVGGRPASEESRRSASSMIGTSQETIG